jgi:hypothetical protein
MKSIARALGVICVLVLMLCSVLFSGGNAYADDPCWKLIAGSGGLIDPPTLTYHEGAYYLSDSPFKYDGINYNFGYYFYSGAIEYEGEGLMPIMMGEPIMFVDGEVNVDVGLYSALTPTPPIMTVHMTIYYANGYKSFLETILDVSMGSGNWSCDIYHEGVFVNESGEYVYHAPAPICEPVPTPTLPPGDNVSEFIIPEYNESSALIWSATTMNQSDSEGDSCENWESIWDEQMLILGVHPYNIVASVNMMGAGVIARNILAFNTSDIPDDAIITGAYLRVIPYLWMMVGESEDIVVGGTHNTSIFPLAYTGEGGESPTIIGTYSESEFYGDFGRLPADDIPIGMMAQNYNESIYTDVWFNSSGLSYINPEGLTALTLRTVGDMNYECPASSMSGEELVIWAGNLSGEEPSPSSKLVIAWHMPGDEPIPSGDLISPQVAVMMDIIAILFLTGGIIGLLFVIAKSDGMSMATKAGIVTMVAVMAVVGVIIIESLVVAFK